MGCVLLAYQPRQERLNGNAKAPMRKDVSKDFPLRGFVDCEECSRPLTASWSTSKTSKKHAYCWCKTKGCSSHRKSIQKSQIENEFEEMLKTLQPSQNLAQAAQALFGVCGAIREAQAKQALSAHQEKLARIDEKIGKILD